MSGRSKRNASKTKPEKEEDEEFTSKEPKGKKKIKAVDYTNLVDIANILRIDSIVTTNISKTGHPTTCASMAEIITALFFHE